MLKVNKRDSELQHSREQKGEVQVVEGVQIHEIEVVQCIVVGKLDIGIRRNKKKQPEQLIMS